MSDAKRQIGGQSNRQGNRYEDGFAVFRSIQLAPCVIHEGARVRIQEQAGCPVDDLLIHQDNRKHYHQLKDDQKITWGEQAGKLRKEYVAQKQRCTECKEDSTLILVVSHDHRKRSLDENMPEELKDAVTVLHFPAVKRPSELARHHELQDALRRISASRSPGGELFRGLVEGFHLAWVERALEASDGADLAGMIAWIRERPAIRLYRPTPERIHPLWDQFVKILAAIPNLQWCHDRGYFEWSRSPGESGLVETPCDSDGFRRFVERVVQANPATFEAFEVLLP